MKLRVDQKVWLKDLGNTWTPGRVSDVNSQGVSVAYTSPRFGASVCHVHRSVLAKNVRVSAPKGDR